MPGRWKMMRTRSTCPPRPGAGIDDLRETIRRLAGYKDLGEGAFTARRRHVDAIALAAKRFERG